MPIFCSTYMNTQGTGASQVIAGGNSSMQTGWQYSGPASAGTASVKLTGSISYDGRGAWFMICSNTRSNANHVGGFGVLRITKGYGGDASGAFSTLYGSSFVMTQDNSGSSFSIVITAEGSAGGTDVPNHISVICIGNNNGTDITVDCGGGLTA